MKETEEYRQNIAAVIPAIQESMYTVFIEFNLFTDLNSVNAN